MKRMLTLAVLILATTVWAQDNSATQSQAAGSGCGPDRAKFQVKRDAYTHPAGTPEAGKALVYVFADSELDNVAFHVGGLITRVGIDGQWVGAFEYKSYTYFSVDPGEHRICTSQQSSLKSRRDNTATAISFTAEEGKIYYFRTQPTPTALANSAATRVPNGEVELATVDPAQAQLMVPKWAYSTSQPKK